MWTYQQSTGALTDPTGNLIENGYSGKGDAKNDPDSQCRLDAGPLPRGNYSIQPSVDHPKLGPVALPLTPSPANDMCGRAGFFIHGDNILDPGTASDGCIIMQRNTRATIDSSLDKTLQVIR